MNFDIFWQKCYQ